VEGAIGGGYEWGLETGIKMAERVKFVIGKNTRLMVAGRVDESIKQGLSGKTNIQVDFLGNVPAEKIPELDRSAHVLYAADINAACPNSVIEALACGLPVVAFNTGALSEILTTEAGRLSPYGGDPWELDPPDIKQLAEAANYVIQNQAGFRKAARKRAEEAFGLDHMVKGYLDVLNL
jgi:glycosyltransferase involved in cell wall biosynthesis